MKGSILLCGWLLLGPVESSVIASPAGEPAGLRKYHEIEREVRELLQRESRAQDRAERAAAAYDLAYLFVLIQLDPRLPASPTLAEFQGRLRSRLLRIKQDVQRDLSRDRRAAKRTAAPARSDTQPAPASSPGNSRPVAGSANQGAMGGRAGPPDWGPGLVELIERTIVPEFWDVNGGPGAIYYYSPLKVLVVRATSEIHHRVGGALTGLRAAGR